MKNRITLTIILALILFAVNVYAEDPRFIGQQNQQIDLKEPCFNNGTYCSSSGTCNITIWRPNNAGILVNNKLMTNQVSFHNYTLNTTQTSSIGEYQTSISCCDIGLCGYDTYTFKITPSGELYGQSETTIYAVFLLALLVVSVIFLVMMGKTESEGLRIFFALMTIVMIVFASGTMRVLLDYTSLSGGVINMATGLLIVTGITFIIIMYVVFVNQTRKALGFFKARRGFGDIEDAKDF